MMDELRERLLRRDYLYGDAGAYRAGVEAALAAVDEQQQAPAPAPTALQPHGPQDSEAQLIEAMAVAAGHA